MDAPALVSGGGRWESRSDACSLAAYNVLGLRGQVLVAKGLQGWLLWEDAGNCLHIWQSQLQDRNAASQTEPDDNAGMPQARWKTAAQEQLWEVRACERKSPADTKIREDGVEVLQEPKQSFSWSHSNDDDETDCPFNSKDQPKVCVRY